MGCDECHKTKGSGERCLKNSKCFIKPPFHNFWEGGEEKQLFQAWLGLELAAGFLSLSAHLHGAAAGLLGAAAPE